MKLPLPAIVVFLFLPALWRTPLHRLRLTLSAATKKPASLAGSLYLPLKSFASPLLLLHVARTSHPPRSLQVTIQTPSSS